MSIISHGGKDYDVPAYSVQDDSSATSLDSSKVPTGGTVQSVYGDPDTYMIKGTDYVTAGQKSGTTLGNKSTVEGYNNTAIAENSHAEGNETVVGKNGSCGHAEGYGSRANGHTAHAEGAMAWATGTATHAEGCQTTASGDYSHAEGIYSETKAAQAHAEGKGTLASSENQHVQGKYNIEDANGIYAHIVGNGTNSSNRSNIHTLDWSGNAWFAGDVTDGSGNVLSDKADTADISGAKSISGNPIIIEDSTNAYAEEVIANIEPIQDLRGYDYPWVNGAGKNKCPLTVDGIKGANLSVTWNGNSCVWYGVTITILTDEDNNVIGLKFLGTASHYFYFNVSNNFTIDGTYIVSPLPQGAAYSNAFYGRIFYTDGTDTGFLDSELTITKQNASGRIQVVVSTDSTVDFTYQPMIRLATETDPTFAPYSNICPISGLDSVEVKRTGKNLLPLTVANLKASNTSGTWNGNVYTYGSIYTINTDSNGNVVSIDAKPQSSNGPIVLNFTLKAGTYYLQSGFTEVNGLNDTLIIKNNVTIARGNAASPGQTFTLSEDSTITWQFRVYNADETAYPMIRLSTETDPTFEPYQSETHTTSLPQTTYGGTLNVQTGELVVDRIYKTFNGGENWYTDSRWPLSYYTTWTNDSKYTSPTVIGFGNYIQCNKYHGVAKQVWYIQNGEILFNVGSISGVYASIMLKDENYTSVADLTTSLLSNPLQIVYELATPQTYYLTPEQVKLLKGHNHITTNADTLDLTYQVDNVLGEILSESEEYTDRVFDDLGLALFKNSKVIPSSGMVASLTVNAESSYYTLMFLYFCNGVGSGVCTFNCHNAQLLQKTDIMRGESNIPFNVTFDTAKKAIITPKTSGNVFYGTILASCNIT